MSARYRITNTSPEKKGYLLLGNTGGSEPMDIFIPGGESVEVTVTGPQQVNLINVVREAESIGIQIRKLP